MSTTHEELRVSRDNFLAKSRALASQSPELNDSLMTSCNSLVNDCIDFIEDWRTGNHSLRSISRSVNAVRRQIRMSNHGSGKHKAEAQQALTFYTDDALQVHISELEEQIEDLSGSLGEQDAKVLGLGKGLRHPGLTSVKSVYSQERSVHSQVKTAQAIVTQGSELLRTADSIQDNVRGYTSTDHVELLRKMKQDSDVWLPKLREELSKWAKDGPDHLHVATEMLEILTLEEKGLEDLSISFEELNQAQLVARFRNSASAGTTMRDEQFEA